jgi:hypothetical protein
MHSFNRLCCKDNNNPWKNQIIGLDLSINALDLLINAIDLTIIGADLTLHTASRTFIPYLANF